MSNNNLLTTINTTTETVSSNNNLNIINVTDINNSMNVNNSPSHNTLSKLNSRRSESSQSTRASKRRKSIKRSIPSESNNVNLKNHKILPSEYIKCEKTDLLTIISRMLTSIVSINDSRTSLDVKYLNSENLTRFHSRSPPEISIYNYLLRLSHYSSLENCVLIATVYYIDLLTRKYSSFALNSLTVHRFLLTATTIASKALCDSFCSNNHYAKVGGVNVIELNLLEVEFLKWVNYRVVPRDFNYDSYCERKNSNGNLEIIMTNSLKFGISTADKILDLYYERMIGLVGVQNNNTDNNHENNNNNNNYNNNNENKDNLNQSIMIGHNDNLTYQLQVISNANSAISSSSSSSTSSCDEGDEYNNNEVNDLQEYNPTKPRLPTNNNVLLVNTHHDNGSPNLIQPSISSTYPL
jgi:hypothetical protein